MLTIDYRLDIATFDSMAKTRMRNKGNSGTVANKTRRKPENTYKPTINLKSRTPTHIRYISEEISRDLMKSRMRDMGTGKRMASYAPSINERLVSLKSMARSPVQECNTVAAFQLKEPLKIQVRGRFFGKTCVAYNTNEAKAFLLRNLAANKHVDPSKVVPPLQIQSNCWFNAMFVTLFVSDKGRKFFHYFRQLMIEGKQTNGAIIPPGLANAFALLNFAIESALNGTKYAYELNTNSIIMQIYNSIPDKKSHYLVGVDEASNPFRYYDSIINYLDNHSLKILYLQDVRSGDWKERIKGEIKKRKNVLPHVIIMEIFDEGVQNAGPSGKIKNKQTSFKMGDAEYVLDSCVVRDMQQQHFCAMVTLEKNEMAYDGMSFHRLVPMQWKKKINSPTKWSFQGSNNLDGTPLKWSFLHGYQMLIYYRLH
jgi:hypothetical protein